AYLTYNAQVNFGGGLVTSATPVDLELFAWPTSIQSALTNGFSFQNFFAPDGASGVLGIGPNSGGPGPSIATQALPGSYGHGVLINEDTTNPYLQFGDQPLTVPTSSGTTSAIATLTGAPITTLDVNVNGQGLQSYSSEIDSGGVYGTIPFTPSTGSLVQVYAPGGAELYQYNYGTTYSPTPSTGVMNTGSLIFQEHPIYVGWGGQGTTVIYGT
ncbi:MAG: PE family protein, partial [Mycobacterium sp.]